MCTVVSMREEEECAQRGAERCHIRHRNLAQKALLHKRHPFHTHPFHCWTRRRPALLNTRFTVGGGSLGYSSGLLLFSDIPGFLAPTNVGGILISGMSGMLETPGIQQEGHISSHPGINPSPTGNRHPLTQKPATESTVARGMLFSQEVSFPVQQLLFPLSATFCSFRSNPGAIQGGRGISGRHNPGKTGRNSEK